MKLPTTEPTLALLYARVSDKGQETSGDGKNSQTYRLQRHTEARGYTVEAVFSDVKSAGGHFMNRPGVKKLLAHLKANKHKRYVVVFDDLNRISRDAEYYWPLMRQLEKYGARPESPNFRFENTPEGRYNQTTTVAGAQLQREQGARQTREKMQARLERGYAVFKAPAGYKYVEDDSQGGMILVRDEPLASIVQEALEGFASGRFQIQAEVKRFLETHSVFPRSYRGDVLDQRVRRLLTNPTYAGYLEAPNWGVSLREGRHPALISLRTFQQIQDILAGKARTPNRKDIREDFPLRGGVVCGCCERPLTASWSKSARGTRHPYYLCFNRDCDQYAKSIRRDVIEGDFLQLLKGIQQPAGKFHAAMAMFKTLWERGLAAWDGRERERRQQLENIQKQISQLMDRVVKTQNETVIAAYEDRIGELDAERLLLIEAMRQGRKPPHDFEETLRTAQSFLASPSNVWESGDLEVKQIVMKYVFPQKVAYTRNEGFRTAIPSLPFKALATLTGQIGEMASPRGFEPLLPP
jgi:site-specific DNA recombinase